jgi:hypothetical protein
MHANFAMLHNMDYGALSSDRQGPDGRRKVASVAHDETPNDPPIADSGFEKGLRQQQELMRQMANREKWDGESQWILGGRRVGVGLLYGAAIVGIVLILWIASSVFLGF